MKEYGVSRCSLEKVWIRESGRERERGREIDFVRLSESAVSAEAQLPSAVHLWASRWRGLHHYF